MAEVSGRLVVLEKGVANLISGVRSLHEGQARTEKHVHDLRKEVNTNLELMKEIQQKGNSDTLSPAPTHTHLHTHIHIHTPAHTHTHTP